MHILHLYTDTGKSEKLLYNHMIMSTKKQKNMSIKWGGARVIKNTFLAVCLMFALPFTVMASDANQKINMLINQAKYDDALAEITARQQAGENQAALELLKGAVLVRSGALDEAMTVFENLAKNYPNDAAIFNNIGVIHAEKGDMASARSAFEAALEISPDYEQALYNLGDVYVELACRTYGKIEQPAAGVVPEFCQSTQMAKMPGNAATGQPDAQKLDEQQKAVYSVVDQWRQHWADQDIDAYLNHYSKNFQPAGSGLNTWIKKRRRALKRPEWIKIVISSPDIRIDGQNAVVQFVQKYTASNYRDVVVKQLTMTREDDDWKIAKESVF